MAIPVKKEPDSEADKYFGIIEACHFCNRLTRYWHENTNNPVCQDCAKKHKVSELPDFGKRIRAMKRRGADR